MVVYVLCEYVYMVCILYTCVWISFCSTTYSPMSDRLRMIQSLALCLRTFYPWLFAYCRHRSDGGISFMLCLSKRSNSTVVETVLGGWETRVDGLIVICMWQFGAVWLDMSNINGGGSYKHIRRLVCPCHDSILQIYCAAFSLPISLSLSLSLSFTLFLNQFILPSAMASTNEWPWWWNIFKHLVHWTDSWWLIAEVQIFNDTDLCQEDLFEMVGRGIFLIKINWWF